jgi:TonB-linked SusC/RagA family outer membrane protein
MKKYFRTGTARRALECRALEYCAPKGNARVAPTIRQCRGTARRAPTLLLALLLAFAACPLFAQQVQGVVIDGADGQPLPGVSVTVKGAATAAMTDIDGHYAIAAPADAVLRFTYIGMKPVEAPVAGRTAVNVQMEQDALQLDDVMVVAYGTSTRKSLTGAVAIVKSDQIGKIQAASVTKALEGLVPGLQTAGGNGQPGSGLSVRIRGFGSINASSAPLYVVDGMVYDGYISALNPDDIESMSVLKDASSAALYGSRAANGVIMVTTKKGREGKMKVNVKATAGMVVRAIDEYSRVNSKDYYELIWESWRNALVAQGNTPSAAAGIASGTTIDGVYEKLGKYNSLGVPVAEMFTADGKVNPAATVLWEDNWQDELFRTARRQEVQASASGANDKTDYFFSFGYLDEQGIVKSSDFSRLSARVSVNSEVAKWLKLGTNFSGSLQKTANLESASAATTNPFYYSRMMAPIYPIWIRDEATGAFIADPYSDADRLYDYGGSAHNTVIDPATGKAIWGDKQRAYAPNSNLASTIVLDRQSVSSDNLSNRSYAEIAFLRDFTFRVNGSIDLVSEYATDYQNRLYGDAYSVNGRSTKSYGRLLSVTWNQLLSWKREFGAHHLDVLAGHESYSYDAQSMYATRTGFGIYTTELAAGAVGEGSSSGSDAYRLESYLSRLNYDYENRYYFSASFRRDGSSRFHPSSRWGNFWSVAAAWNISQEAFLSGHDWIDHLKLKLSYGGQGNDDIGTFYAWQQLYTIAGYDNGSANGAFLASLENKDLQWEVNNNLNIGAEFKLFNRLSGEINWFNRMSDNLLFLVPNPQSTGIGATYRNVGAMRNRGIEIQIAGDVIKTADFLWNVDFNLTHISNKITKLPQKEIISGAHKLTEGHSLYDYWLRESAGVDPATGDQLYYMDTQDGNGNTVRTTTNDHNRATYYYVGTAIADAYGGLTNTFTYKNLELSVLCTYSIGGQAFDNVYASLMHNGAFGTAFHTDALNRWQQPGDVTDVPRLQSGKASQTAASSRYLIDASYLTVKNVTLNYMLPKQWVRKLRMENVRLFLSADNLYIESARKGLNPQQSFSGITDFGYVPTATYTLGLSFNF